MRKIVSMALLISSAVFFTFCGNVKKENGKSLNDGEWVLETFMGTDTVFNSADQMPSIVFNAEGGKVSGFGGCNRFMGNYSTEGKNLNIDIVGTTMAYCPNIDSEQVFVNTLGNVTEFAIQEDKLYLFDDQGNEVAVFVLTELKDEVATPDSTIVITDSVNITIVEDSTADNK